MANEVVLEPDAKVVEGEIVDSKVDTTKAIAAYSEFVSDAMLIEYKQKFSGLSAQTKEGYEEVRKAIAVCRTTRTGIEKKRKELNEDAQSYIRTVNGEAKRLTAAIEAIEEPLKTRKQAVDDERERLKAEAEAAKAQKINDRLVAFLMQAGVTCSVQDAEAWTDAEFENALALARDAYQARLKAEQEAEAERQRIEAERQETLRKQQEEIERQRAELEQIRAAQQAELDRLQAEQEAARMAHEAELERIRSELAERDRIEQEKRKAELEKFFAEKAEQDRIERERLEAERAALVAENERLAKIEADRLEALRQQEEAARKAEEERVAAEIAEQQRIAEEARLEALKPDLEKAYAFCEALTVAIRSVPIPVVQSAVIRDHFDFQVGQLILIASAKPSVE